MADKDAQEQVNLWKNMWKVQFTVIDEKKEVIHSDLQYLPMSFPEKYGEDFQEDYLELSRELNNENAVILLMAFTQGGTKFRLKKDWQYIVRAIKIG